MSMIQMKPMYNTSYFNNFFPDYDSFLEAYKNIGFPILLKDESIKTIYYLIYAKWGNTPVANLSETQFKLKLFSVVYTHGPAWERRTEIQEILRGLSEEEILRGAKIIYNNAENPSTTPTTGTLEELTYIDRQSVNKSVRGKLDAYAMYWDMIKLDITSEFINRFKICFKKFVESERPLLYEEEEEE